MRTLRPSGVGLIVSEAVPDQLPVLRNLSEFYVYDFTAITPMNLSDQGRFDYDFWTGCWTGERTPYLFHLDGRLAGFAIVAHRSYLTGSPDVRDVAEFFVLRGCRRQGLGTRAATQLFVQWRGTWEVRQQAGNDTARAFWRHAISVYADGKFAEHEIHNDRWHGWVQRFGS